jgi:hypothetical protein
VYVYTDVPNYGCGSSVLTFGLSVSGCIHELVNCKLEFIRLIFMCMLIYQTMFEGIIILNKCLSGVVIEVFPREGG